jgi:hypothetical protein
LNPDSLETFAPNYQVEELLSVFREEGEELDNVLFLKRYKELISEEKNSSIPSNIKTDFSYHVMISYSHAN